MTPEETTMLNELQTDYGKAHAAYIKYDDICDGFEAVEMVGLIAPVAVAAIGMLSVFVCSFVDKSIAGKLGIVYSYLAVGVVVLDIVVAMVWWYFAAKKYRYDEANTRLYRSLNDFKKVLGMDHSI